MPIRNYKNIFNSSLELLDLLLSIILGTTGMYMLFFGYQLATLQITHGSGTLIPLYSLFSNVASISNWGIFFSIVSLAQIINLFWYQKPNPYINAFIKTNVSFSFLFLGLANVIHHPFLISTIMFLILSLFSLFSLVKSK